MTTRSSRSATKLGIAALVSFSLVAAACGGSDSDADSDTGTDNTEASEPDASVAEPDAEPDAEPPTGRDLAGQILVPFPVE